jgi:uncharacterized membrane protein
MDSRMTRQESTAIVESVHWALLSGVILGGILIAVGLVLVFVQDIERPDVEEVAIRAAVAGALHGNPVALLYSGLVALMLTPVARVVILVVGWFCGRQWRFALVALCVLLMLCLSLYLGTG